MSATGGAAPGNDPRTPQDRSGRGGQARANVQRTLTEQRRKEAQRKRLWMAGIATAVVVIVTVTMVVLSRTVEREPPRAGTVPSGQAVTSVTDKATSVPAAVLNRVGMGTVLAKPIKVTDQKPLTADGKPVILYVGAEYCPFCASQRWAVVVALSRFGTFVHLGMTHSASEDVYPNTQSFSFHGATYTSRYLAFQGVELTTNERQGNGYAPLDELTSQQRGIMEAMNAPPYVASGGGIPFMDLGNKYLIAGGAYDPGLLQNKTAEQIADALSDPETPIARAVLGTANMITAHACRLTGNQPVDVCSSAAVSAFGGLV